MMPIITYSLPQVTRAPVNLIDSKPPRLIVTQVPKPAENLPLVSVTYTQTVYTINQGAYAE